MFSILTNMGAMIGIRQSGLAGAAMRISMERLSTGRKVNQARDAPADIGTIEELKYREKTLRGQLDDLSLESATLGAKEGTQSVLQDLVISLNAKIVAAANTGALSDDERAMLQIEVDGVLDGIDFISGSTTFRGEHIVSSFTSGGIGRTTRGRLNDDGSASQDHYTLADLRSGGRLNMLDGDLELAQQVTANAVTGLAGARSAIGIRQKAIDAARDRIGAELESILGLKSSLVDTDFASETANLFRSKVLEQVGLRVTKIAMDQQKQTALALLSGLAGG